jgi:nickel-type superoxide dismutase maturation protease
LLASLVLVGAGLGLLATGFHRIVVEGASMEPTLSPGDHLLAVPAVGVRPGDVVAVADPRVPARLLVKRVISVDRSRDLLWVEGDNRDASSDSRHFGPVPRRAIIGKVVYRYRPAERAGPLAGR